MSLKINWPELDVILKSCLDDLKKGDNYEWRFVQLLQGLHDIPRD